ncbi:MAG: trimethylamine methyltransferase, partial [Nitrososphaeria archaeon]|nr:trimethylamine methyltransferase [Nitrososphaeria archaeon]
MLIIDNEILEGILRLVRGFEVNDDSLALDVIRRVGPGGHYLAERHTLNHFLEEHWVP